MKTHEITPELLEKKQYQNILRDLDILLAQQSTANQRIAAKRNILKNIQRLVGRNSNKIQQI